MKLNVLFALRRSVTLVVATSLCNVMAKVVLAAENLQKMCVVFHQAPELTFDALCLTSTFSPSSWAHFDKYTHFEQ